MKNTEFEHPNSKKDAVLMPVIKKTQTTKKKKTHKPTPLTYPPHHHPLGQNFFHV